MNTGHRSLLFLSVVFGVVIPWMMYAISEPFKPKPKMENLTRPITTPSPSPLKYPPVAGAKAPAPGLQITCDSCDKPLIELGALLFSPPEGRDVRKYHICQKCFYEKFNPQIRSE